MSVPDPACPPLYRQHLPENQQGWAKPQPGLPVPAQPYPVTLTVALLAVVALTLLAAFLGLAGAVDADRGFGGLLLIGVILAGAALLAAVTGAAAFSFVRNGRVVGPTAIGGVLLLLGLGGLVTGVARESAGNGLLLGTVALLLGALIVALPFTGGAPNYLSARREQAAAADAAHAAESAARYERLNPVAPTPYPQTAFPQPNMPQQPWNQQQWAPQQPYPQQQVHPQQPAPPQHAPQQPQRPILPPPVVPPPVNTPQPVVPHQPTSADAPPPWARR